MADGAGATTIWLQIKDIDGKLYKMQVEAASVQAIPALDGSVEAIPVLAGSVEAIPVLAGSVQTEEEDEPSVPCPRCSKEFYNQVALFNHLKQQHNMGWSELALSAPATISPATPAAPLSRNNDKIGCQNTDDVVRPDKKQLVRVVSEDVDYIIEDVVDKSKRSSVGAKDSRGAKHAAAGMETGPVHMSGPSQCLQGSIHVPDAVFHRRSMSEQESTEEPAVKEESSDDDAGSLAEETIVEMEIKTTVMRLPDDNECSLDSASTVKTEPGDLDLKEDTIKKVDIDIGPPVYQYMEEYKRDSDADATAGTSHSIEPVKLVCNERFSSTSDLKRHARIHTVERPYSCEICNKRVASSASLKAHMRTHTGELPYICEICNKSFSVRCNLKCHMRTHTGERPYSCEICNKNFSVKSNLKCHMKTHAVERPYSCEICNKSFYSESHLTKHRKTHTGERPYSCEICNKNFSEKSNLKCHMMTHAVERPYSCEICNKSFYSKSHLTKHRKTHTGERPYSCEICNKSFSTKCNLKAHMKTHSCESEHKNID